MTTRAIFLLIVAGIAGMIWANLAAYGVIDSTIDRLASQRMAASFEAKIKNVTFACFPVRRAVKGTK